MALSDLQKELNQLVNGIAKGEGGAGGDDPFRKELNFLTHSYTYSEKQILDELLNIKVKFDASGKRVERGKDNSKQRDIYRGTEDSYAFAAAPGVGMDVGILIGPDAAMLTKFSKKCFEVLNTVYKKKQTSKSKKAKTKWRLVQQGKKSTVVVRAKKGQTVDVYKALSGAQSQAMGILKPDFQEVFRKGSRTVGGKELYNIGHRVAVTHRKVDAVDTLLSEQSETLKDAADLIKEEISTFRVTHGMDAVHSTEVHMKGGKLVSRMKIIADVESWYLNQNERAGKETLVGQQGGWVREDADESKKQADTLIKRIRKHIQNEYDAETDINRKRSDPFIQTFGEMIINVSGVKRLARTGVVINNSRFALKIPKSKKPIKATKTWTQKGTVQKATSPSIVSGFGALPPGKKTQSKGSAEDPNSMAPLMALLQSKLPETVAKNMGPPGLQNQTGRFASSVQVTDVTTTAQGFPSVGYTYQKNPYQVFEVGQGDPRWATTDRDPRKLIDASIREIAAQQAIGRFYTRRV